MSVGPVATAKVLITPDLTGFQALLQAEVTKAVLAIKVPPIKAHVVATSSAAKATTVLSGSTSGAATSTAALAASTTELTGATTALTGATVKEQAAALAVTRALEAQRLAEERLAAAQLAGAKASRIQALENKASIAAQATNVSRSRLAAAAPPVVPPKVGGGLRTLTNESNAARGALIGLSRVTPVTIFGLGLYGTAALAAGLAIKGAIKSTADFEHQLNIFQATTGATADQMAAVGDEAKKLGADLTLPATSAGDAAKAMTELAKAGLSVQDTLAGAKGVLQLAAAAQIDVGAAAQFVATELNAFELSGRAATHVADLLAGASIAAQGDIRDFGTAFQQVSAVAHQANVSLETTTGLLTELARAGLRGADAGTSIRTFLLRLTPTTKQAAQYQEALNIRLDKSRTIGEQLPQVIDQYRAALSALAPIQQQQVLTQIFGQDAIRAAAILTRGGSAALRDNTDAANQNGAAARLAAANAKGLSGAFNGLKSNADTLGITLGSLVKGPLTDLVITLSKGIGFANTFADSLDKIKPPKGLTNSGAGRFALVTALGPIGETFALEIAAAKRIADSGKKNPYEQAIEDAKKQIDANNKAAAALADAQANAIHDEGDNAVKTIQESIRQAQRIHDESDRFDTKPILTNKEKAAIQARVDALTADKKKNKPLPADIAPPIALQDRLDQAQLDNSLKEELTADKAIEAYFRKRLTLAKVGTKRYIAIKDALTQAHAATQSVLGQIASDNKSAQAARDANLKAQQDAVQQAIANQRTRLETAAQAAGNVGPAEQKLIAFYRKEAHDVRLTEAERLGYQSALITETKSQTAGIVALAKAEIDLRNSRLDLAIQRAQLTDTPNDDRRRINNKIKALQQDIKNIQKFKHLTVQQKQEIVDLQSAITDLLLKRKSLSQTSSSGFSLNDLFAEAQKNFNQFASNVSTSVTTGGGVRGAFSAAILSQKDKLSQLEQQKLAEAAKSNDLLAQILTVLTGTVGSNPGAGSIYDPVGPANFATAAHARSFTGKT